jgi:co-chaperonin GroES (HSP10)
MSGTTEFKDPDVALEAPMPQPTLWRILVRPLQSQTHSDAGIELTKKTQEDQQHGTVVGQVVAMGELAYTSAKLQDSHNPGVGDWVLFGTYGGQRIDMADGRNFILMNDDAVMCVVDDPEPYRKKLV